MPSSRSPDQRPARLRARAMAHHPAPPAGVGLARAAGGRRAGLRAAGLALALLLGGLVGGPAALRAEGAAGAAPGAGEGIPAGPEAAAEYARLRAQVFDGPDLPVMGNPQGSFTIVEFSDYNCPFCRRTAPEVTAFLASHPQVRLVVHEVPIFGEGSREAATVALAAARQGRYAEFHRAMMAAHGKAGRASALRVARGLGLDMDRLERDMQSDAVVTRIETSLDLADRIGLMGTPSFVIGEQSLFGYLGRDDLAELVAEAEKKAGAR